MKRGWFYRRWCRLRSRHTYVPNLDSTPGNFCPFCGDGE